MNFTFHNKLSIRINQKVFTFYNKILKNIFIPLSNLNQYNQFLALGDGNNTNKHNEIHQLTHHIKTLTLQHQSMQSDITKGELYATYTFSVPSNELQTTYLTEIGLGSNEPNPTLYNYFNLITENTPNGLDIRISEELCFEVTIYLNIQENTDLILTAGNNPFIEYLLGNGLQSIYTFPGSNYNEDVRITREASNNHNLFPCNIEYKINGSEFELTFATTLNIGEIDEIVFTSNNKAFARKNLKNFNPTIKIESSLSSQSNYVIKLNEDIKSINSVINPTTNTIQTDYLVSKYANDFGDKVHTPFHNMFKYDTSRFVSKDGNLLFFLSNEKVYAFKNQNHIITKLDTKEISDNYILNIISFDNFVFVISKISPYITTYQIVNGYIIKIQNNIENFEKLDSLQTALQIDITQCKNSQFMIGVLTENKTALTLYLEYDSTDGFKIHSYLENTKEFNYVIALYKTSFNDGQIIYLKAGETSASSRIVTHYSDKTETDVYSYFAYALTHNASRIYSKGRAIISEKINSNNVTIYYYPQIQEYTLQHFSDNQKTFLSHNLNYLVKSNSNNELSIFNLIGYDTPERFVTNISDLLDSESIQDIEFLNDSILFFTNNEEERIIAFNLKLNKTQIENLAEANKPYLINYDKYNKLGSNQETVLFNFTTRITIWFFLKKYTK